MRQSTYTTTCTQYRSAINQLNWTKEKQLSVWYTLSLATTAAGLLKNKIIQQLDLLAPLQKISPWQQAFFYHSSSSTSSTILHQPCSSTSKNQNMFPLQPFLTICDPQIRLHILSWCDGSLDRSFTLWANSHSSQCSMTGVTKAMVCAILSVGWCI